MQRSNIISAVGIAALLLGCSDQPAPTETGIAPLELSTSTGQVVQSVTGSGHYLWPGPDNAQRIFTDVAHTYDDGTVGGQWERLSHFVGGPPAKAHGVVTCMRIDGNKAYLGGYATSGVGSEPPNNGVAWYVIDNGEGATAEPDIMSMQRVRRSTADVEIFCATGQGGPGIAFPILAGNIQVKP